MLAEAVGQLVEGQANVLEADLLADDMERHGRKPRMHGAHHPRQHRAVADAGIEQAEGRRSRPHVGQFLANAVGDHLLLAASGDEQQVFLAIVEEAEVAALILHAGRRQDRPVELVRGQPAAHDRAATAAGFGRMGRHIGTHPLQRARRDATAVAQACDQFAVVDGESPEGRFREPGLAAVFTDLTQQVAGFHRHPPGYPI